MKLKVCYYCGTKYSEDVERCPLCGQTEIEPEELDEVPAAVTAADETEVEAVRPARNKKPKAVKEEQEPAYRERGEQKNAGAIVVCVILALIVLAGIAFILHSLGVFSPAQPQTPANPDSSLDLPVDPGTTDENTACQGITVMPTSLNFGTEGIKAKLTVTLLPAQCQDPVAYTSSDEKVVTVSPEGEVTAIGEGRATITVACGSQNASVDVYCSFDATTPITPAPGVTPTDWELKDVKLSTEDFTLFKVGETATIKVVGLPADAAGSVKWEINDSGVATVENGKVTAVSSGKATVTATIGSKKLTCIVRCSIKDAPAEQPPAVGNDTEPGVETIKLRSFDITFRRAGEVSYNTLYKGNTRFAGVQWTSADPAICTVESMPDNSARLTAVAEGTTTITAVYEGKSYECTVRCVFTEA